MGQTINISHGNHNWDKKNLVTLTNAKGMYDVRECSCGLKGKAYTMTTITLDREYAQDKVDICPNAPKITRPDRIKITKCDAQGSQFANLTPGSEHDVVDPPKGEKDKPNGVWVIGIGERVKVLNNEFIKVKKLNKQYAVLGFDKVQQKHNTQGTWDTELKKRISQLTKKYDLVYVIDMNDLIKDKQLLDIVSKNELFITDIAEDTRFKAYRAKPVNYKAKHHGKVIQKKAEAKKANKRQVGDTKVGKDGIVRVWSKTPSGFDWRRQKKTK